MTRSTVLRPSSVGPRVILAACGVVVACTAVGVASASINTRLVEPTTIENSAAVLAAPELSAQARDAWYLEPRSSLSAPALSAQARDTWYLETTLIGNPPALSEQSRDRWYLEKQ
jgi:hypothetical protein